MIDSIVIREYRVDDVNEIGMLISDTYRKYNLSHIPDSDIEPYLDGFYFSRSEKPEHKDRIKDLVSAPTVLVALSDGRIAGVLRGSPGRLHSLFVHEDFHRQGIGRALMSRFESEYQKEDTSKITLAASLYAVPFYKAIGYRKSTGVRKSRSFRGTDFHIQPMKKSLVNDR